MNEEEIKDIESLKKLREDTGNLKAFRELWPLIKPLVAKLGVDTKRIDDALEETRDLATRVEEMASIPDEFNDLFVELGWVFFESMDLEVAKKAIEIAEEGGLEEADGFLVDYFSPKWVENHINRLRLVDGFQARITMAEYALEDYRSGRYYASVLIILSLIDGWVNEKNIVDFQRHGYFSESSRLIAWDSIAAHPKGLMSLKEVMGKPRLRTRTEDITIPYRHGIIHGMDLGYNNKFVAAKCWALLFAVREWVIKAVKGELEPPELELDAEKTLWESIEGYLRARERIERLKQWRPRELVIGNDIPSTGAPEEYAENTPERKLIEFLQYWQQNNYGFMSHCFAPMLNKQPGDVRRNFQNKKLVSFEMIGINDVAADITDIQVAVSMKEYDATVEIKLEFRIICSTKEGKLAYISGDETMWGVTMWRNMG